MVIRSNGVGLRRDKKNKTQVKEDKGKDIVQIKRKDIEMNEMKKSAVFLLNYCPLKKMKI